MAFYKVLTPVGLHTPGEVIEINEQHAKDGVDADRLIRLGAIEKHDGKHEGSTPIGVSTDSDRVIREIPFAGSPDPLRSESPPTLPQAGYPDETTPIGGKVSGKPSPKRVGG